MLSVAMAHDQGPQLRTESEEHEPVLILGMHIVRSQQDILVEEDRLRLFESDAMPPTVGGRLALPAAGLTAATA